MTDRAIFEFINGFQGGAVLDWLARLAASSAFGFALGLLALGVLFVWRRDRSTVRLALILVVSVAVADLVCGKWLKPQFARARPCHQWGDTVQLRATTCGGEFGFPSNHAANNGALVAGMFGLVATPVTAIFAAIALFVAWSRIYVGAHFPSDVMAGLALGAFIGFGVRRAVLYAASRLQRT